MFTKYQELKKLVKIVGYGEDYYVVGIREVIITVLYLTRARDLVLLRVIHIP